MLPDPLNVEKQRAAPSSRLGSHVWLAGKFAAAVGVYACVAAAWLKLSYVSELIASVGAALLLLAAALFDSGHGALGDIRPVRSGLPDRALIWFFKRLPDGMPGRISARYNGYKPCLSALLLGLSALAGAYQAVQSSGGVVPRPEIGLVCAGLSALLALILIVAERYMAALPVERLAHAPVLARMLRLPIAVCAIGAAVTFAESRGYLWAGIALQFVSYGVGIVAVEIMVRAVLGLYDPLRHDAQLRGSAQKPLVDSMVIAWLRPGASPWRALGDYYAAKFDIDLRQSWGVRFILRAAPGFLMLSDRCDRADVCQRYVGVAP